MKKILFCLSLFASSVYGQEANNLVELLHYTMDSKILETERTYWVSLPQKYDSTQLYPVLYILDAEWKFNIANAVEKDLSGNGKIPKHIVVGIPHPNRRLDMTFSTTKVNSSGENDTSIWNAANTGNGSKFLQFIEEELMTEVNRRYSTNGFNVMAGHSLGGYFCSYILPLQHSFRSLQIYDPSIWYSDGEAIQQIKNQLSPNTLCTIYLASSGTFGDSLSNHHQKIEELYRCLQGYPNIRSAYKCYEDEHHNSMYLPSFIDGMSMLYEGYEMRMIGRDAQVDVLKLEEHYKQFSKAIQFDFNPPRHHYLTVGELNFHQKKYQNCIEALEIYLSKNSLDPYAFELIGDAYFIIGDKKKSLKAYQEAKVLSPENIRVIKKIEKLK